MISKTYTMLDIGMCVTLSTRRATVLILEEDVDGGGWAAVNVRVPATRYVFHEANVTSTKHVTRSITGANFDFPGQMNDQPAFG